MNKLRSINTIFVCSAIFLAGCTAQTKSVHYDDNVKVNLVETSKVDFNGPRLKVGVVDFLDNTPGKVRGIETVATNILTTMLSESVRFIVIPQQEISAILDQQKPGSSGMISATTAAQMGKVLGLNAILTGSITSYDELVEGSSGMLSPSNTLVVKVGVDYSMVDSTTGLLLFASHSKGVFRKKSGGMLDSGSKNSYDMSLKDGALRDALGKALNKITEKLTGGLWSGRIVLVKGSFIYINAGKQTGLKIGDTLVVQELGEEIIDPQTGVSLGRAPGVIRGKLKVAEFFGKDGSVASVKSGKKFKKNDLVKLQH